MAACTDERFGEDQPHTCPHCSQIIITHSGMVTVRRKLSICKFTYAEVEQAAREGCPLLKHRLDFLRASKEFKSSPEYWEDPSLHFLTVPLTSNEYLVSFHCEWRHNDQESSHLYESLGVIELEGVKIPEFPSSQSLNRYPGSSRTAKLICKWANTCRTSHSVCAIQREKRQSQCSMPSRLLCISTEGGQKVVLHEITPSEGTEQSQRRRTFAALTYCWGRNADNFKLTTQSIDQLRHGVAVTQLPTTIQHAICTARAMDIAYIWIDALCIIQDDNEDMKRELPKMVDIYSGAFVIISAAVAASCQDGFLQPRKLADLMKIVYKLPFHTDKNEPQDGSVFISEGTLTNENLDEPIDERAWTFQEHLQAVALLRFGSRQVTWTCQMSTRIDGGITDQTETDFDPKIFDGRYYDKDDKDFRLSLDPALFDQTLYEQLCDHWRRFVASYTKRSLSEQEDTLPAFSIIAHNFNRRVSAQMGRYCAGLWESDVARQLLWFKPKSVSNTTQTRLNPTWSWSTLPGPIFYPNLCDWMGIVVTCAVVSCSVQLRDVSWAYGPVESGTLIIDGKLRTSCWPVYGSINTEYDSEDVEFFLMGNMYLDIDIKEEDHRPISYLEIVKAKNLGSLSYGLVLQDIMNGKFQRIGYYSCPGFLVHSWDEAETARSTKVQGTTRVVIV